MTTLEKVEKQPEQNPTAVENSNVEAQMNTYLPRTDIVESEDAVNIWAEMPGLDSESVSITLEKNVLTLDGKFPLPVKPDGYTLRVGEFPVGNYHRTFRLSQEFDCGEIEAKMKDGVLCLILPRRKDLGPKKVTVMSE